MLEIEITRQDYVDLNFHFFKKKNLINSVISGIVGLIVVQYFLNKDKESLNIAAIIISSLFYIGLFVALMYYKLKQVRKLPRDDGSILGKKTYQFLDDCILFQDRDSEGRFQWQAVKSFDENKKAFYLYLDTVMVLVIPKRYFIDKNVEQSFRSLVNRNALSA